MLTSFYTSVLWFWILVSSYSRPQAFFGFNKGLGELLFSQTDVLLACVILSLLSVLNPLWYTKKLVSTKLKALSTGLCPTRLNILSGSASWQQTLHCLPRKYTRRRPTVTNASLMSGTSHAWVITQSRSPRQDHIFNAHRHHMNFATDNWKQAKSITADQEIDIYAETLASASQT